MKVLSLHKKRVAIEVLTFILLIIFGRTGNTQTANNKVSFSHLIIDSIATRPEKPYGKAIGDINGDGLNDIFISSANNGGMFWYQSPSWKKFPVSETGSWSEDCLITDIDQDDDEDIVNSNKEGVFWYENKLKEFDDVGLADWPAFKIGSDGTNVHDIETADFNMDGKIDIVVRYEKEFALPVTIFFQMDHSNWKDIKANQSHLIGEGLAVGDVDNDGDNDLVLDEIWCENRSNGQIWVEHVYADSLPSQLLICLADINKDEKLEIIVCPQSTEAGALSWYENNQGEEWKTHNILPNINNMHGLAIADFNNDGFPDIHTSLRVDHTGSPNNVSVWISNGKKIPSFKEIVLATSGSHFSKAGDLDGDGDIDILGANFKGNNPVEIWLNQNK